MKDIRDVMLDEITAAETEMANSMNAAMQHRGERVAAAIDVYIKVYDERLSMLEGNPATPQETKIEPLSISAREALMEEVEAAARGMGSLDNLPAVVKGLVKP